MALILNKNERAVIINLILAVSVISYVSVIDCVKNNSHVQHAPPLPTKMDTQNIQDLLSTEGVVEKEKFTTDSTKYDLLPNPQKFIQKVLSSDKPLEISRSQESSITTPTENNGYHKIFTSTNHYIPDDQTITADQARRRQQSQSTAASSFAPVVKDATLTLGPFLFFAITLTFFASIGIVIFVQRCVKCPMTIGEEEYTVFTKENLPGIRYSVVIPDDIDFHLPSV